MKKNTSKTPLMQYLKQAFKIAFKAEQKKNDLGVPELIQIEQQKAISRRKFIIQTAQTALIVSAGSLLSTAHSCKKDAVSKNAKIVIVGAGMAGLHAAYLLEKAGFSPIIYEASSRTGGRMYSATNIMANGLTTEIGGEFIDSNHQDMLNLAQIFGLSLIDVSTDTTVTKDAYFFNNQHYTLEQVINALTPYAGSIKADIDLYNNDYDAAVAAFDNLSMEEYFDNKGITGWLKSLLVEAFVTEFGLNVGEQACLNFIDITSVDFSNNDYDIFGESDERYKINGGNQQVVDALANALNGTVYTDQLLESIKKVGNTYKLNFLNGLSNTEVSADIVILTLPFSMLRNVNLDASLQLPSEKIMAINELGYGTNAKLMLGFNSRIWRTQTPKGYSGYLFTDNGIQTGWDNSQLQNANAGGYTIFSGGTAGISVGNGSEQSQADIFLPKLNQIFAGALTAYNGNVKRFHWPTHPFTKGSYACYKVGQWGSISGNEFPEVGNLYFAGEHCSEDFQGYMNGAAETGRRVAEAIIDKIG